MRGTNWVGDAVMTIPALRALRRILPNAHITLATRSLVRGMFYDADFLDDFLIYDRRGWYDFVGQAREWRGRRFDLALLLQNAFEAALIAACARVPVRFGYATDGRGLMLTHAPRPPVWRKERHEVFYYLNLVSELEKQIRGASDLLEREPNQMLRVSQAREAEARGLLQTLGAQMDRPLVALCPGSTNSRAKRWPSERYAALADRCIEEMRAQVVLIGAPDETEVSGEVSAQMRHEPIILTGCTSMQMAVAVLSLTDLLVTNDTGPAHIAAALNRPTLVIFGPTDPTTTRPFAPQAEIIQDPPDCAPCMLRDCPIDHRCMTAISPEEVFARARALLLQSRAEAIA